MPDIVVVKRLIDYVGLNARGITEQYLELFKDVGVVLALNEAMGPDGATLLNSDAAGNLKVTLAGQAVPGDTRVRFWGTNPNDIQAGTEITGNPWVISGGMTNNAAGGVASIQLPRTASAINLAAQSGNGVQLKANPGEWSAQSQPAAGAQASATRAAGGAGVRHICTSIDFSAVAAVAPVATVLAVNLRDGATGAGTILRSWLVFIAAAIGQSVPPFGLSGLSLVGSAATAMTLEFSALLANLQESVSFSGYDAS